MLVGLLLTALALCVMVVWALRELHRVDETIERIGSRGTQEDADDSGAEPDASGSPS